MKTVCGLGVHKDSIFMCILKENGEKKEGKFGTLTSDLDRMRDLTVQESVSEVVMESTGIYPKMSIKIQHIDNEHLSFSNF